MAVAAMSSMLAPPSLHVECRWQSPLSAERYSAAAGDISMTVSASSFVR